MNNIFLITFSMHNYIYYAYQSYSMSRPKKQIPLKDVKIKGLKTLIKEGKTQEQIADYYRKHDINVDQATISRRISEIEKVTEDDDTR
ncbi:hypothetical protein DU52_15465 [Methanosarcina mazei]|uniref:Arginine repressor DNA-binding domain-containing protein n=2 Tax=Methanosarcina mazei TaxID=2209 RepID=A0A0F8E3T4_METMZ|nr:hypothetical protein DU52_15465 [Methanosarcina mazei]